MSLKVVIVDYGMGNLWSVHSALTFLGVEPSVSNDPGTISRADQLILPGVGSFGNAMSALEALNLLDSLREAVLVGKKKILGICLGMQLFAEHGCEDGDSPGLGFIPGKVERFTNAELGKFKIPHIGFNSVSTPSSSILYKGLSQEPDFYFVHSYRLLPPEDEYLKGICNYGIDFMASYERDNIFSTQFHPEKSQTNGLKLLSNFLSA